MFVMRTRFSRSKNSNFSPLEECEIAMSLSQQVLSYIAQTEIK